MNPSTLQPSSTITLLPPLSVFLRTYTYIYERVVLYIPIIAAPVHINTGLNRCVRSTATAPPGV